MAKTQVPKLMRQSGELHGWNMILVNLYSIKRGFLFGARTSNDSNRARLLVTHIDRVPLDVLLDNCNCEGFQSSLIDCTVREENHYVFR